MNDRYPVVLAIRFKSHSVMQFSGCLSDRTEAQVMRSPTLIRCTGSWEKMINTLNNEPLSLIDLDLIFKSELIALKAK